MTTTQTNGPTTTTTTTAPTTWAECGNLIRAKVDQLRQDQVASLQHFRDLGYLLTVAKPLKPASVKWGKSCQRLTGYSEQHCNAAIRVAAGWAKVLEAQAELDEPMTINEAIAAVREPKTPKQVAEAEKKKADKKRDAEEAEKALKALVPVDKTLLKAKLLKANLVAEADFAKLCKVLKGLGVKIEDKPTPKKD